MQHPPHVCLMVLAFASHVLLYSGSSVAQDEYSTTAARRGTSSSTALVPFTYAGQEIMRTFHAPFRVFTFGSSSSDVGRTTTTGGVLDGTTVVIHQRCVCESAFNSYS